MTADVTGLDLGALTAYLDREVTGLLAGPLSGRLIAGGRSNLTYLVTDGVRTWVVRRPPLGHVLETAHDMGREHRVMAALADSDVPVPEMVALCRDADVIGGRSTSCVSSTAPSTAPASSSPRSVPRRRRPSPTASSTFSPACTTSTRRRSG